MKLSESQRITMLGGIDKVISGLPEDERRKDNPKKTCNNCYNLGATLIPLGLYWARARCRYCDGADNWSHILELRKEIENAEVEVEIHANSV